MYKCENVYFDCSQRFCCDCELHDKCMGDPCDCEYCDDEYSGNPFPTWYQGGDYNDMEIMGPDG